MTITYVYDNKLYLNITNRCTNACDFCVRTTNDGYYSKDPLWLEREPTLQEILEDIFSHNLADYTEMVFCGYGEPTCRLDILTQVCDAVRAKSDIRIRVNTNGQSDLIWQRDTAPDFANRVDVVSVSLNTADAASYQKVCHCRYGEAAYQALLQFAARVKHYVPVVQLSVVRTTIPDEDIAVCQSVANRLGVILRVRELV